jgi:hypothetical protein
MPLDNDVSYKSCDSILTFLSEDASLCKHKYMDTRTGLHIQLLALIIVEGMNFMPIPVAVRSVSCECYVLSGRSTYLRRAVVPRPEESCRVWCV